ncbi:hypothetical protein QBC38DRAFT_70655 [Podospora fimiseda]|uniref:CFEM domain-containing protein n=1 Tax=Podospora fimiseda TaxID=252190 RepID=A0AAN7H6M8_9PEZI|nr:hypothetical protein QBC38DRAFT_70655 [Podospora fimiseda]
MEVTAIHTMASRNGSGVSSLRYFLPDQICKLKSPSWFLPGTLRELGASPKNFRFISTVLVSPPLLFHQHHPAFNPSSALSLVLDVALFWIRDPNSFLVFIMRFTVFWSLALFSSLPSVRGDGVELPPCGQPCLQSALGCTNCPDIQCLCTRNPELQQLFQCIFTSCNAAEYSSAIKTVTEYCVNSTITDTVQQSVGNQSPNTNALVARSSPIHLDINLNMVPGHDVEPAISHNAVPMASTGGSTDDEPLGHETPIEMNISLNYDNKTPGGTPTSTNPNIHVEMLLSGTSITTEQAPVVANCPPTYPNDNHYPAVNPPGPFVSSGPPINPPGPFFSSGPPSGGNGGNNSPPRVITTTQAVTVTPVGGSTSFGAGGYNYGPGQGSGGSGSGAYGAGAGNGNGGNNGQVLTIVQTTTVCLNSGNGNNNGSGYGNGNRKGDDSSCPPQPVMSGPFVETVFIMGTPSPLAIVPPPPAVVTVTQMVAAPQPPPPPAPLAYPPPNSVAYFGAKVVGEPKITTSTDSFYTVTLTVPAGAQLNGQLPGVGSVSPASGNPDDCSGTGTASGSGVASIPAIPPSVWGGGGVRPTQVTASRATQDAPSLSVLFTAISLAFLQAVSLSF